MRDKVEPFFVTLCIASLAAGLTSKVISSAVIREMSVRMLLTVSKDILDSDLRYLEKIGNHALFAALTEDLTAISQGAISVPNLFLYGAFVLGCFVYIGWLSSVALLATVAILSLGALTLRVAGKSANGFFLQARNSLDNLHSLLRALANGAKELKMHQARRQEFLHGKLRDAAESFARQNFLANFLYSLHGGWTQLLYLAVVFALVFPLPAYLHTPQRIVAAYTMILIFMMGSIGEITNRIPVLARGDTAIRSLERLTASLKVHDASRDAIKLSQTTVESIRFEEVTFTYLDDSENRFSIGPLSLTLRPGELLFVTGGNGSGKSTLVKLLAGLYAPSSGNIYLNDQRIDADNREWYSEHISAVFSDFYLFNSLMGLNHPQRDEEANRLIRAFNLAEKVRVDSGTFSTIELSQGQRKRLALVTVCLEDRPVYVFDEWAAEQEPQFRRFFYREILQRLKSQGKVVVVITHDDDYFDDSEKILKLDYGRVVQGGRREFTTVAEGL
jgi:putative ATP-binding cassette transporter